MGRILKIVNILSKPTPEGFKIWILANANYILDFMWHTKGEKKGLVNLNISFIKGERFLKI